MVRLLGVFSGCLLLLGVTGWWLTTRILSDNGSPMSWPSRCGSRRFRQYIAEQ